MGTSVEDRKGVGALAIGKEGSPLHIFPGSELGRKLTSSCPLFLETGSRAIAQVGLEFGVILLPSPPKCSNTSMNFFCSSWYLGPGPRARDTAQRLGKDRQHGGFCCLSHIPGH